MTVWRQICTKRMTINIQTKKLDFMVSVTGFCRLTSSEFCSSTVKCDSVKLYTPGLILYITKHEFHHTM